MLCSWNWRAITFWKRHLLSTQWVCRGGLSHTYFPSMVAVHFSSSQIAIFILRTFSGKQQYNFTGSFCLEEAKSAKCSNQFQFSEQDKGSNHCYHFVKFAVLLTEYVNVAPYPHPSPCKNYHLVLTGHSLGAGVASLLAVLFKPKHPTLHCYAYSPPGCVIRYCNYKLIL